jgi:hypothetical protein
MHGEGQSCPALEKKTETEAEEWEVISSHSKRWKRSKQINAADLVVGILANLDQESVAKVHEALRTLHGDWSSES